MNSARQTDEEVVSLNSNEAIQSVTKWHGLSDKGWGQDVLPLAAEPHRQALQPYGNFVRLIRHGSSSKGGWQIAPPLVGATQ